MGEAVPLPTTPQAAPPAAASAAASATVVLPVTVLDLPESYPVPARPVQLTGTVLDFVDFSQLTLRTSAGLFQLDLQEILASPLKSDFIRQTIADFLAQTAGSGKTLSLLLKPEGQEMKASLLLPLPEPQSAPKAETPALLPPDKSATLPAAKPIVEGLRLAITILPKEAGSAAEATVPRAQPQMAGASAPALLMEAEAKPAADPVSPHETLALLARKLMTESGTGKDTGFFAAPSPNRPPAPQQDAALTVTRLVPADSDWPTETAPREIRAVVTGKTPTGHLLLQTDDKTLYVKTEASLPVGTKILGLVEETLATVESRTFPAPHEKERQALRELVHTLARLEPDVALNLLQSRLPDPTQNIGGSLLFFLSALQGGKLDEWLGRSTFDRLERHGKRAVAESAVESLAETIGAASDPRVGEWKTWPLPLVSGHGFDMLRLYVHEDSSRGSSSGEATAAKPKQTRFLIAMTMSRLGPMQIDGLSRSGQLDLVIRSQEPLPPALPDELRATFYATLEALGLSGTIAFQAGRKDWIILSEQGLKPQGLIG